jgi:protein involved in polysaccharide export with SLBB domain
MRCALFGILMATGCRGFQSKVDQRLMADKGLNERNLGVAERYAVICPDVLDIVFDTRPELGGLHPIGVDGRLDLEPLGRPRVEGQTVEEIAHQLADLANVRLKEVHVAVAGFRSQCVYLFGEVIGLQRAVAYHGQETVLDLLQRTGGIKPGAEPEDVYVVRTHVGDNKRPEVFHVDLRAIVLQHDQRTNLRLQPFDQVHVGETRRAGLEKCVPPWLRPWYQRLCGWTPTDVRLENAVDKDH